MFFDFIRVPFLDDRYSQNPTASGLLNSTINKLHQQQQSQQPSTSRLSNVVPIQQSYASRMRPQLQAQMGQPTQLSNGDLADSVLLPTSSQSPQNQNGSMYLPQTLIKSEPQYNNEMVGHEEYVSFFLKFISACKFPSTPIVCFLEKTRNFDVRTQK
jgi:hypothetical protein